VLIGGGERKTLRLVAQYADIWHIFADPATLQHKISVLRQHCTDVGRDPAEIEICAGTEDPGARPEELGAELRAEGASLFTVNSSGPGYDLAHSATGSSGVTNRIADQDQRYLLV